MVSVTLRPLYAQYSLNRRLSPRVDKAVTKTAKFIARPGIEALILPVQSVRLLGTCRAVLKTKGNVTLALYCSFVSHKSKPSEHVPFGTAVTNKRSCTSTLPLPSMTCAGRTSPTYVLRKALAAVRWQLQTDVQCDVIAHVLTIATACMLLLLAVRLRSIQTLAFVPHHMKQFHNL